MGRLSRVLLPLFALGLAACTLVYPVSGHVDDREQADPREGRACDPSVAGSCGDGLRCDRDSHECADCFFPSFDPGRDLRPGSGPIEDLRLWVTSFHDPGRGMDSQGLWLTFLQDGVPHAYATLLDPTGNANEPWVEADLSASTVAPSSIDLCHRCEGDEGGSAAYCDGDFLLIGGEDDVALLRLPPDAWSEDAAPATLVSRLGHPGVTGATFLECDSTLAPRDALGRRGGSPSVVITDGDGYAQRATLVLDETGAFSELLEVGSPVSLDPTDATGGVRLTSGYSRLLLVRPEVDGVLVGLGGSSELVTQTLDLQLSGRPAALGDVRGEGVMVAWTPPADQNIHLQRLNCGDGVPCSVGDWPGSLAWTGDGYDRVLGLALSQVPTNGAMDLAAVEERSSTGRRVVTLRMLGEDGTPVHIPGHGVVVTYGGQDDRGLELDGTIGSARVQVDHTTDVRQWFVVVSLTADRDANGADRTLRLIQFDACGSGPELDPGR